MIAPRGFRAERPCYVRIINRNYSYTPNPGRELFATQLVQVMDDDEFVARIHRKIERMTQRAVEVQVDREELNQLQVDLHRDVPLVVVGSNVLQYSGFARMCIEYAVESIKQQRTIDTLEFHLLLARN